MIKISRFFHNTSEYSRRRIFQKLGGWIKRQTNNITEENIDYEKLTDAAINKMYLVLNKKYYQTVYKEFKKLKRCEIKQYIRDKVYRDKNINSKDQNIFFIHKAAMDKKENPNLYIKRLLSEQGLTLRELTFKDLDSNDRRKILWWLITDDDNDVFEEYLTYKI